MKRQIYVVTLSWLATKWWTADRDEKKPSIGASG